jgi:hypothetical protein
MTTMIYPRTEMAAAPITVFGIHGTSTASESPGVANGRMAAAAIRHQLDAWFDETMFASSVAQMTALPSYKAIVRLGKFAVPFLLLELKKRPADWFLALAEITGENPVPADARGVFDRVCDSWLRWGAQHGYI